MRKMEARVIRKRERLGMTQGDMGRELGVSRRTVQRLEYGPFPELVLRYLDVLGYRVTFTPRRKEKKVR